MDETSAIDVLQEAARRAVAYVQSVRDRPVAVSAMALQRLDELKHPLPRTGLDAGEVVRHLDEIGSPATVATTGGRYFGMVIGGALPATVAASWLATAWDQNASFRHTSPIAAVLEDVSLRWLTDLFGLPDSVGGAFVTGASMANMAALASARHALLARLDWDVEAKGLYGAPELRVIVSGEIHVTLSKALSLLGLGRDRVIRVPTDRQGRLLLDELPALDDRTIVCIQAGNVNTGDFDPAAEVCRRARDAGAWVHVDGAFGLWALAHRDFADLAEGVSEADSWATDAHKWLNVPYDSGIVLVRRPADLRAAMSVSAAYLAENVDGEREPSHYTPESSRRARGIEIWAALLTLGRDGIADLVERNCRHARAFARGLEAGGFEILNDVVLNQVLVSFGSPETTRAVICLLQAGGVCWCGGTVWQGRTAMRISVSSWATTNTDVQLSIDAMIRAAEQALRASPA
ncbi:aspartate aminotransferase family protein [Lichenicola cladoniae]|uniref:Aspartate aminotransferase family protein n=1 Tax=Lichenicola cladoniae TaxID=1484109 RepID=A0A6M8HRU4_9PROT|nr:aminotransferase class V-fold PLP-dependent enzyme [Lichenicola cladoniae]NPD65949.1 aspartate aminotransferase family protein [Acetobacteraceae bacterium]QKE91062.1 aspartate aminotransferase family protein [Lichenicola cladoniae]